MDHIFFLNEQEVIITNFEAIGSILDIGGWGELEDLDGKQGLSIQ